MNFFADEKTAAKASALPRPDPAAVVILADFGELTGGDVPGAQETVTGTDLGSRKLAVAMDDIDFPEVGNLDSLPASPLDEGDGVIQFPLAACLGAAGGDQAAGEQQEVNDPSPSLHWLDADVCHFTNNDHALSTAGDIDPALVEIEAISAAEVDTETNAEGANISMSEDHSAVSYTGNHPHSETAAIPPVPETKLWTGLGGAGKKPQAEVDDEALAPVDEAEWSSHSADVAFVAAILKDVAAPGTDSEAVLEESDAQTEVVGGRSTELASVPAWKPIRSGLDGKPIAGGGDENIKTGDETTLCRADAAGQEAAAGEPVQSTESTEGKAQSGTGIGTESPSMVRTPRNDSIAEGLGNFFNDSVVLDAAFNEPDFKALDPNNEADEIGDFTSRIGEAGSTLTAKGGLPQANSALVRHEVSCPACEQALRIQNRYLGIEGRCPACSQMIIANRLASGVVIAEMAEVEAPKFFQQPNIEPDDVWGGTRLVAGRGQTAADSGGESVADTPHSPLSDDQTEIKSEPRSDTESELEADGGGPILASDQSAKRGGESADVEELAENKNPSESIDPSADPFSNPSRCAGNPAGETDSVWGSGFGKPKI